MQRLTVLITGVAGFLGSGLASRLVREGYAVVGVCSDIVTARKRVHQEVRLHECDVRSPEIHSLFEGVDVVFHFAAKSSIAACQEDPVSTISINVVGTANVFEAARRANVRKVVYASSAALEESAKQKTFYAISKAADERLGEGFTAAFGLPTVGLRYFNIYGPGQDYRGDPLVINRFIDTLAKGQQPILFEGYEQSRRDFVHIDDVHNFHLLCIKDTRVDNRVFRLGSGKQYTMLEIIHTIQKILGTTIEPIVKSRTAVDAPSSTLADITDALALGWEPKVGLEEGLRSMIARIQQIPRAD
jgi:UDP-glucose 4-epimerase